MERRRYTVKEVGELLRLAHATVYRRIADGLLEVTKDGYRTFVTAEALERYLQSCEGK